MRCGVEGFTTSTPPDGPSPNADEPLLRAPPLAIVTANAWVPMSPARRLLSLEKVDARSAEGASCATYSGRRQTPAQSMKTKLPSARHPRLYWWMSMNDAQPPLGSCVAVLPPRRTGHHGSKADSLREFRPY